MFVWDVKNIVIALVGVVNIIEGVVVYTRNRISRINFWFLILVGSISLWMASMLMYRGSPDYFQTVFLK